MQNLTFQDRGIALSKRKKKHARRCGGKRGTVCWGERREDEKIKPFLLHSADGSAKKRLE